LFAGISSPSDPMPV